MYAVIQTGGKQYRVTEGDIVYLEKLDAQEGAQVEFDVVALGADDGIKLGTPLVDGAKVVGTVVKTGKAKKITVFTYRPKKGSKRKIGHRQPYTKVQIQSVSA